MAKILQNDIKITVKLVKIFACAPKGLMLVSNKL